MSGPYDQSFNEERSIFGAHLMAPFKRKVNDLRQKIGDLVERMGQPAFVDQYPANTVPFCFSKIWDVTLTAARRNGAVGFEGKAAVVDLGGYVLPRNGNILVGRDGPFTWCSSNISGYYSLTYDSNPGFGVNTFVNTIPVSDLFNRAIEENGGALQQNNFFGHVDYDNRANICFDLELYDKRRGVRLHEERLPPQILCAQEYGNKNQARSMRFDVNTEIEPRVRLLEVRPGSLLDTDAAYDAAQFKAYLAITFKGYKTLDGV